MLKLPYFFKYLLKKVFRVASIILTIAILFAISNSFVSASDENIVRSIPNHISTEKWLGDFDGMIERKKIRALVSFNKMLFFLDGPYIRGISVELLTEFEKYINSKFKHDHIKLQIVFIPTPREKLLSALLEGQGDIAVANLTITKERRKLVDFSDPFLTNVNELIITGPSTQIINSIYDLSGKAIHTRPSSSYFESLKLINFGFQGIDLSEINIVPANEYLEDSDLLEMVNANLIPAVVVDSHIAQFWAEIFENIKVHNEVAIRNDGEIAWAFRKDSPQLKSVINEFVKQRVSVNGNHPFFNIRHSHLRNG